MIVIPSTLVFIEKGQLLRTAGAAYKCIYITNYSIVDRIHNAQRSLIGNYHFSLLNLYQVPLCIKTVDPSPIFLLHTIWLLF